MLHAGTDMLQVQQWPSRDFLREEWDVFLEFLKQR